MNFKQLVENLINPDNNIRNQSEKTYEEFFETQPDNFVIQFLELFKDPSDKVRHAALTLFHSALNKKSETNNKLVLFERINNNLQVHLFPTLIEIFKNETSVACVRMLSEILIVISMSVSKFGGDVSTYFQMVLNFSNSPVDALRILMYSTLSQLIILFDQQVKVNIADNVVQLWNMGLHDNSLNVAVSALDSYINTIIIYDGETEEIYNAQQKFIQIMPSAIELFGKILNCNDNKLISQGLQIVGEFSFIPKEYLQNYVMIFVKGLLTVAENQNIDMDLRFTAMNSILELILPFKLLFKREINALQNIFNHLFNWLSECSDDLQTWATEAEALEEEQYDIAQELVDQSSDLFGGEIMFMFIKQVPLGNWKREHAFLKWINITLNSGKHYYKKHLEDIFQIIQTYSVNQHPRVRNAASDLLNSTICLFKKKCKSYSQIVLSNIKQGFSDQCVPNQIAACDILSSVIDVELISQKDMAEISMSLFQCLTTFINNGQDGKLIVAAFASLNFLIHYLKGRLNEVFATLFEFFKQKSGQLNQAIPNCNDAKQRKNILKIKSRLIEGLSMLVYACEKDITKQIAIQIFEEVYNVFNLPEEDRDILMPFAEKAFTRLAPVLKEDIQPYLNTIVPIIIQRAAKNPEFGIRDANDDNEDWAITAIDGINFGIKTSQIEEKGDALSTLDLFVEELKGLMVPFVENMSILVKCMKFEFDDSVRFKATTLVRTLFQIRMKVLRSQNPQTAVQEMKSSNFYVEVFKTFLECIKSESDSTVSIHKIETLKEIVESLGENALTAEELENLMTLFGIIFEDYESSTIEKMKETNSIQNLTDEEIDMIDSSNESESDSIMACQHLFQAVIKYNQNYQNSFNNKFYPWLWKFYTSQNSDFHSTAIVYVSDLVIYGNRQDIFPQVMQQFISEIHANSGDIQFNVLLSLAEIVKHYPQNLIQPYFNDLVMSIQKCQSYREDPDKKDIYEVSLLTQGSLLIFQPQLCQGIGINVEQMINQWFGSIMFCEGVKDFALVLAIEAVAKGFLVIDTPDKFKHYVNYVGETLVEETLDEPTSNMLRQVIFNFKGKFPEQVFNEVWSSMTLEAREEIFELLNNKQN